LLKDGDIITIDAVKRTIEVNVSEQEFATRRTSWKPHTNSYTSGALWKYAQTVGSAEKGAVTHGGGAVESHIYADL
jgi:dihydroxy-acid dehydratase